MDPNFLPSLSSRMQKAADILRVDLSTIRTGRAAPAIVESISVSVYGGSTKLRIVELATVSASDSQTLVITPFDASIISEIRKGIMEAQVGLNPVEDSGLIRISIPPLSTERRQELISAMKQKLENGKIMIRQIRHEGLADLKKNEKSLGEDEIKRLEKEIQTKTDNFITEIENLGAKKEQELLAI